MTRALCWKIAFLNIYLHKYVVLGMELFELVFVEYMFFVVDIDMGYKTILGTRFSSYAWNWESF